MQNHEITESEPALAADASGAPITTELSPDDPRWGFAAATMATRPLIDGALSSLDRPTPCAEFSVEDLLDHLVMVMRRFAAIGAGRGWASVQQDRLGGGWADAFAAGAHNARMAWDDPAKLEAMVEVPWGTLPGFAVVASYTAELATHAWDLATATGQDLTIADADLAGALVAAKAVPAEGRGVEMPFDPVVDPGPGASVLLRIAGWFGRSVA